MARAQEWCPDGWDRGTFAHGDHSHAFYTADRGTPDAPLPTVMLMHEFPGISENLVELANVLAADFRVVVPSIVGRDGNPGSLDSARQLCVRRELHVLARDGVSTSVGWLRDFAHRHVADSSGRSFGVIGLCLTGNFALALAVDPRVAGAVVAEPAGMPVRPSGLGLSDQDRAALQQRVGLQVQGYRFRRDCLSPASKLAAARELLGDERMRVFTLTSPNQRKHSTLTGKWRNDGAVANVRAFLRERLAA
ncbi:dienelactone hydrolase family protein [Microbacterium deminutum]|uniref:Dienelactone hydrolase domain-containing protein n=1 Tax=Microbacterium deminutum TaxID=344164 RepID=A0ABN2QK34_9MICO